jgi:hypothetical protein
MDVNEIECLGVDESHTGQKSDQWRVLANTVMNFKYHERCRVFEQPND